MLLLVSHANPFPQNKWNNWICAFLPGVVGWTSSTTLLLLSVFFFTASVLDSLCSIEFIGKGVNSFNLAIALFRSSLDALRNVWKISSTYSKTKRKAEEMSSMGLHQGLLVGFGGWGFGVILEGIFSLFSFSAQHPKMKGKKNWGDALLIFTVNSPKFREILTSRTVASPFLNFGYVNFNCPVLSEFRLFTSLCRLKLKCTAARICLQEKTLQYYNLAWVGVW